MEIGNRLVLVFEPQIAQRIHEERGPAAHFITQHGNARTGMVECLHDDKFQLITEELLDRRFVPLFDLRVIRQHANGPELLPAASFVRCKKLLHGFRRVRPVVQNLR